jgi:hypothetical protein
MAARPSALTSWTPEQIALGQRWVGAWKLAAVELDAVRRQELRQLDPFTAIALLCGPADYHLPPHAPKPASGLVEQQRILQALRPQRP